MAEPRHPAVSIAGAVGGCSVAIVLIVSIFAKEHLWVVAPVVGILALMALVLGALAARKKD